MTIENKKTHSRISECHLINHPIKGFHTRSFRKSHTNNKPTVYYKLIKHFEDNPTPVFIKFLAEKLETTVTNIHQIVKENPFVFDTKPCKSTKAKLLFMIDQSIYKQKHTQKETRIKEPEYDTRASQFTI